MTTLKINYQSSINKVKAVAAEANPSDLTKLNRKISAVNTANFCMETNSVSVVEGCSFWQRNLVENQADETIHFLPHCIKDEKAKLVKPTPQNEPKSTKDQEATQNKTVFANIVDIRIPSNIIECQKTIQTKLIAKKNYFGDDLFQIVAWERGKEEPDTDFKNIRNYFIVDIYANKNNVESNISFRALDKKKEEKWNVSDFVESFFSQYKQINTIFSLCKIPFISDKDPALVNQMKNIFSSKKSNEQKVNDLERYLFTKDPVGKTVIRALARIGYQVVRGSLEWADDDSQFCYGQHFSAELIPGQTFLSFKIRKTEKVYPAVELQNENIYSIAVCPCFDLLIEYGGNLLSTCFGSSK